MSLLSKRRLISTLLATAFLFVWISPVMIGWKRCLCLFGNWPGELYVSGIDLATMKMPACCGYNVDFPRRAENIVLDGTLNQKTCVPRPSGCCTAQAMPKRTVNPALLTYEQRPSFQKHQYQGILWPAFPPPSALTHFQPSGSFDKKLVLIPQHLRSTVLLI